MSILHISQKRGNFTQIDNEILRNESISGMARLVYFVLQSYGKSWNFNAKHISGICGVSLNTLYKYMKELYDLKLLKRIQAKDESGKWTNETIYVLVDYNENLECEINLDFLDSKSLKELEKQTKVAISNIESSAMDLSEEFEDIESSETLENVALESSEFNELCTDTQKSGQHNFNRHINIKDSNNTKKEIAKNKSKTKPSVYASIDLHLLLKQIKDFQTKAEATKKLKKEEENARLRDFLAQIEWSEQEAYNDFIAYRSEKKKLKQTTINAIRAKFLKLKSEGEDLKEVVKTSIERGWSGLFAKRETQGEFKGKKKIIPSKNPDSEGFSFLNISYEDMRKEALEKGIYL